MEIIHDPREVERFARQRKDENWDFRAWIKGHGPGNDELNELVQELTDEAWAEVDCTLCANRVQRHRGAQVRAALARAAPLARSATP